MTSASSLSQEKELYGISWSNPAWSHLLCSANVLDYFCDLSNPFYDRQCNNEVVRMQRLSPEQLLCMTGIEFYLHQAQEPILFVIRKQRRLSSTQVTPLAYYYIINGTVLQAPDLATLINSRLLTTVSSLMKVLQTLAPCARYHPSDGSYSWDDPDTLLGIASDLDVGSNTSKSHPTSTTKSEQSTSASLFQVQRTDFLLAEWAARFPPPSAAFASHPTGTPQTAPPSTHSASATPSAPTSTTIKEESASIESHPVQARPPVKPPILPGVGLNAMSLPSTTFVPSSLVEKKPRVS